MIKRIFKSLISVFLILSLSSCATSNQREKTDLTVFAAASLTESLNELKDIFEKENPDINIIYNFDSSGTLKTQIEEGADCDVFISAAKKQMDELGGLGDKESEALIDSKSRFDLLENEVSLATKKNSNTEISSFEDLKTDKITSIALGNSDVPVGQYSKELLENLGIWDGIEDKVSYGSNVKEVTTWISEGAVDCGIVYSTDANAAGLKILARPDPSKLKNRIIYPVAITKKTKNSDKALDFLEFLKSDKAQEIFIKYGFKKAA